MNKDKLNVALITNCTMSSNFGPLIRIEDMPVGATMDELLAKWVDAYETAVAENPDQMRTPGELYSGISFDSVTEIAQIIGHENIFVVNRGAGLVRHDEKIVPYDFSYSKNVPNSAKYKVTGEKFLPKLWWLKINAMLRDDEHPISTLTDSYNQVIVALPDNFIRLVALDLALVRDSKHRLFITVPRSWKSTTPAAIRDATVPYASSYTQGVDYNRFNKAHRMTLKFIQTSIKMGSFEEHANEVRNKQVAWQGDDATTSISYPELFEQHPILLEVGSASEAVSRALAEGIRIGSRARFVGAWRGATDTLKVDVDDETLDNARSALRDIMESTGQEGVTDEELLEQVGVFVAAVGAENPTMIFTSRQVAAWGRITYPPESEQVAKKGIRSGGKVGGVLRAYTAYLGLEQLTVGASVAYRLLAPEGSP